MSGTIPPGITVVGAGNPGDLDARIAVLENIIPSIQTETASIRNATTNLAAALNAQIECCDTTNARLDEAITTLSDGLESLSLRIGTIEAGMNTLLAQVTALETFNTRMFTLFGVIPSLPTSFPTNRNAQYMLANRHVNAIPQFYWRTINTVNT